MKYILSLLMIISLFIVSCKWENDSRNEAEIDEEMSVDEYIALLSDNAYTQIHIPAFTPDDIPALLQIDNSKTVIENFPRNPLSSYAQLNNKLGFVALWTIKSIRKSYNIKDIDKYDRYPSQNAVAIMKDTSTFIINDSDSILDVFALKYQLWRDMMVHSDFNYIRFTDPLEGTGYRWK